MTVPVAVDPAAPDLASGLRDIARAARGGSGPLLLVAADLRVHPVALADLGEDPRPGTAVLAGRSPDAPPDLRVRAGRVVAVGTPVHPVRDPDTTFAGALRVGARDRPAAAEAADRLAGLAQAHGWGGDPLGFLVLGLVRSGVRVGTVPLDPWPWARGDDPRARQVQARLDAMSPAQVRGARLRRAGKAQDGVVATLLSRPVARRLTPVALRLGLSPNQVTLLSVLVGLAAAAGFAVGRPGTLVAGAVLLQLSLVLDCVDGDVARYRRMFTPVGAWLDASTDRLKEFACYGGLAWGSGAGRAGWLLAAGMLTLQTARHSLDYTFTAVKDGREAEVVAAPLDLLADPAGPPAGGARAVRALELSQRSSRRAAVVWVKKALHLGIGERWTVLAVLAAAGRPRAALAVLLGLGLLSLLYVGAGRTVRARAWPREPVTDREREIVAAQVDGAPLLPAAAAAAVAGGCAGRQRFLWLRPALLRAGEYAGVLALTAALPGTGPAAAAFVLLLVVASHHYDSLYRVLHRLRPPGAGARVAGLGFPGRLLAVALLVAVGGAAGQGGLWVLAGGLGILFLGLEPARVLREVRARADALEEPSKGAWGG